MQILTPTGYIPIEEAKVGTPLLAYDINTGEEITNNILEIRYINGYDDNGEWDPNYFFDSNGFYTINGLYTFYKDQSIWVRKGGQDVAYHVNELVVGDVIYDDNNNEIVIHTIEQTEKDGWWKLEVSGDHSYIVYDLGGITLHNASRYWVGGTGTWSSADTTKWSATSGGASGSSVPGTSDLANFDNGTGGSGTITLNYSPTLGGITGGAHTGTLDLGSGTVTMSSNSAFNYSGTGVRTLNLNSATIVLVGGALGGWNCATSTNMTLTAGTSTISCAGLQNSSFQGGGLTYNNVTFTVGGGGASITGANTYANLNLTASASGRYLMDFNTTQTVTGTFTGQGSSSTNFGMIVVRGTGTNVYAGITATINAANVSISNIIFVGIIGTGAGSWTGTNIGNGGGCTGITFTTPTTRYWVATAGGGYTSTTSWSTSSGGASGASIPLPQDTVVFGANSITSGGAVITLNHSGYPTLDFTNLLNTPKITFTLTNGGLYFFGDLKLSGATTSDGINGIITLGSGTQNFSLAGHTLGTTATTQLQIASTNLVLTGNWNGSTSISLISGTFNANGFDVTCSTFVNTTQNITRALVQGNGQWTLTGNNATIWSFSTITGYTFTKGSLPIKCTYSGATGTRSIAQGSFGGTLGKSSYPDFWISAGSDIISCSSSRVGTFNFTGFSGTLNNETRVIFGDWILSSAMTLASGTNVTTLGAETGDTQYITTNGETLDFPVSIGVQSTGAGSVFLLDNITFGSTRTVTLNNGTFDANGYNVTTGLFSFSGSNTRTLRMKSGTWTLNGTGTVWNCSITGGLTFDAGTSTLIINNTSASSKTLSIGANALTYNNIQITAGGAGQVIFSQTGNLTANQIYCVGSKSIQFKSSTTYFVGTFAVRGTSAGNMVTITSSIAGTAFTLSDSSGVVSCDYLSLKDSAATGGAYWFAGANSTDVSGNSGWVFTAPPPSTQEAFMEQNYVKTLIGIASYDGRTVLNVFADPVSHALLVTDGTGGSNNGGTSVAVRDGNRESTMLAVSNADGSTIVQPYVDYTNQYLMVNSN